MEHRAGFYFTNSGNIGFREQHSSCREHRAGFYFTNSGNIRLREHRAHAGNIGLVYILPTPGTSGSENIELIVLTPFFPSVLAEGLFTRHRQQQANVEDARSELVRESSNKRRMHGASTTSTVQR